MQQTNGCHMFIYISSARQKINLKMRFSACHHATLVILFIILHTILLVKCNKYIVSEICSEGAGLHGDAPQILLHGQCEQYITSKQGCTNEITRLGLSNSVQEVSSLERPLGCYGYRNLYYYNINSQSTRNCGYQGRACICTKPECQPCKGGYSRGGLNTRCTLCPLNLDKLTGMDKTLVKEQCSL